MQAAPLNVPTWTGRHGEGGLDIRPAVRRFGNIASSGLAQGSASFPAASGGFSGSSAGMKGGTAPRSSDLLAHLKQRQQNATAAARSSTAAVAETHHAGPEVQIVIYCLS